MPIPCFVGDRSSRRSIYRASYLLRRILVYDPSTKSKTAEKGASSGTRYYDWYRLYDHASQLAWYAHHKSVRKKKLDLSGKLRYNIGVWCLTLVEHHDEVWVAWVSIAQSGSTGEGIPLHLNTRVHSRRNIKTNWPKLILCIFGLGSLYSGWILYQTKERSESA
jgi:hypothetical protein